MQRDRGDTLTTVATADSASVSVAEGSLNGDATPWASVATQRTGSLGITVTRTGTDELQTKMKAASISGPTENTSTTTKEQGTDDKDSDTSCDALSLSLLPMHRVIGLDSNMSTTQICANIKARDLPETDAGRAPVDIIVALDVSRSMHGKKLRLCKHTVQLLLRVLRPQDRFGLVSYAARARIEISSHKMSEHNKIRAMKTITSLETRNGTNLSAAISLAFQEIRSIEHPNRVQAIFLLTDGHATVGLRDDASLIELTRNCVARESTSLLAHEQCLPHYQAKYLRFYSTKSRDKMITLDDYISRMGEQNPVIFYVTGKTDLFRANTVLQEFQKKGHEVLFVLDSFDVCVLERSKEYRGMKLVDVGKEKVNLHTWDRKVVKAEEYDKHSDNTASDTRALTLRKSRSGGFISRVAQGFICSLGRLCRLRPRQRASPVQETSQETSHCHRDRKVYRDRKVSRKPTLAPTANAAEEGSEIHDENVTSVLETTAIKQSQSPITLSCFGYGSHHKAQLLVELTSITEGGTYYFVENDKDIGFAFGDAVGGITSMVAQNVVATLEVPEQTAVEMGVKIEQVFHDGAIRRETGAFVINVGDFYAEESRDVLFRVQLAEPRRQKRTTIKPIPHVLVKLSYKDTLERVSIRTTPVTCAIARPPGCHVDVANNHVSEQWLRIFAVGQMKIADELAQSGNLLEARFIIKTAVDKVAQHVAQHEVFLTDISLVQLIQDLTRLEGMYRCTNDYQSRGSSFSSATLQMYRTQRCNRAEGGSHALRSTNKTIIMEEFADLRLEASAGRYT